MHGGASSRLPVAYPSPHRPVSLHTRTRAGDPTSSDRLMTPWHPSIFNTVHPPTCSRQRKRRTQLSVMPSRSPTRLQSSQWFFDFGVTPAVPVFRRQHDCSVDDSFLSFCAGGVSISKGRLSDVSGSCADLKLFDHCCCCCCFPTRFCFH